MCVDEAGTHHKASETMGKDAQRADASKPSQKSLATRFISDGTHRCTLPETFSAMSYAEALKSGSYIAPSYPAPPPCKLLMLCAEIRNDIYELAFTTDASPDEEVDLLAASAPSGNLLRTSSQIHAEAKGLFATARDSYWSTTNFTIVDRKLGRPRTSPKGKTTKAALAAIPDAALQKITKLQLKLPLTGVLRTMYVFGGRPPQITAMGTIEWIEQDHWQVCSGSTIQRGFYISIRHSPAGEARPRFFTRPPPDLKAIREAGTGEHSTSDVPVSLRQQLDVMFRLLNETDGGRV
ncbi:unnamed protein product [Zymoseptoria tritici ST99CH_1E4]|uniref:Uncharacterized protein n=1 Tax=Zymoseptoria tritici ST99CH_1E4 TaxID=1276532 RepID=A0A2H1GPX9_ZYMTR|nr:unnamed protein product [Zymoseptoria tritici ST99CH_1E4]